MRDDTGPPNGATPSTRNAEWRFGRPAVRRRIVMLAVLTIAAPAIASAVMPDATQAYQLLVWLLLLVPVFLVAYFTGRRGVLAAVAVGLLVLASVQAGLTLLGYRSPDIRLLAGVAIAYVLISIGVGLLADRLHAARMRAEELALTDELTGLPNRRYVQIVIDREFAAAKRGRPLVIVHTDIDRFGSYNERYGRAAGDDALRAVGHALAHHTRTMNVSGRWGGEEFLTVLSSSEIAGALVFVERVKSLLREGRLDRGSVTISCGIAAYQPGMRAPEDLVTAADAALYETKAAGIDSLRVHQPTQLAAAI